MKKYKLSYFDMNGGRAEPIRIAFHIGGIAFEDYRFAYSAFQEERLKTPLGQVPVLEIDGVQITQSTAILRYVGKLAGLYPTDEYQALICDEIISIAEDMTNKIVPTLFLTGEEQKAARIALAETELPKFLKFLAAKLEQQGGIWFADNRLTIAELRVFALLNWLTNGTLDHMPKDVVAKNSPNLVELHNKLTNYPSIVSYYAKLSQ